MSFLVSKPFFIPNEKPLYKKLSREEELEIERLRREDFNATIELNIADSIKARSTPEYQSLIKKFLPLMEKECELIEKRIDQAYKEALETNKKV